jgi:hypothetical protein
VYNGDPMSRRGKPSNQSSGVERLIADLDAASDIAPLDDAAFGKKAGELIARSASGRKRPKRPRPKVGQVKFASQGRRLTGEN